MSESDWDTVTVLRKKAPKASTLKTESAVNLARRQGIPVETNQKYNAGTNKQHVAAKNTAKLDRENEELKHKTVSHDVSKLIMQGRQAKGLSQKDLATTKSSRTTRQISNGIVNGVIHYVEHYDWNKIGREYCLGIPPLAIVDAIKMSPGMDKYTSKCMFSTPKSAKAS
ncbi:endothelial differentiation-related factor 1 isoform X1 [Toxorhynchites rutilus septentrionalis]|uniref:endothelial differentiation-related factor 1 isoform X1 n=1 Tax=Toxorhynchites rutilus septentrionalis TaxID=329112 RepID=UPI00247ACA77|nr:endothelial differentiation-related factor 1 isoform X1 [Toxorhynchites rutilus septentrionalis]XP_055626512.1 endothelial differentiation-related factor 1 isoform X1 [Toxorhynchites rutilus septentrionalis]